MNESAIDVEPIGDGVAIHLPYRQLGNLKRVGWIIVALSLMGAIFLIGWISTPLLWGIDLIRQGQMFGWLLVAFGSLGFIGLFAAVRFLTLGICILCNRTRCSITVSESRILGREKFGWFSFKSKWDRSEFKQIFVMPIGSIGSSREVESGNRSALGFIESFFGGEGKNFYAMSNKKRNGDTIGTGYPKEVIDAAAVAIAAELNRNSTESVLIVRDPVLQTEDDSGVSGRVTVQDLTEEEVEQAEFILPKDSQLETIEDGDSKVYRVPERTLVRGTNGLFFFSVLWNGFILLFTTVTLRGNQIDWGFVGVISIFWIVGIALLVGSIYMARQSALIGVKDGLLFIERKTIFGTRWTEFTADQVESIEMGHSNMEVNGVPVMNLTIKPHEGKSVGMFMHLDNEEIQWLAQQLRRSLDLRVYGSSFAVGNFDSAELMEHLSSTNIEVQQDHDRTTITVPPHRFEGARTLGFLGLAFTVVPVPATIAAMCFVGFEWPIILFAVLFSCMGAVMFFIHRMTTSRNYQIVVTSQQLDVAVDGFMPCNGLSATRPEILSVDVLDSETRLNNQRLLCLKIKVKGRNGLTMMTGRDSVELVYVARLIHQRLQLDASGS